MRQERLSNWVSPVVGELQQRGTESVTGDKAVITQEEGCYGILQLLHDLGKNVSCWLHSCLYVSFLPAWLTARSLVSFPFWIDFYSFSSGQGLSLVYICIICMYIHILCIYIYTYVYVCVCVCVCRKQKTERLDTNRLTEVIHKGWDGALPIGSI